MARKLARTARDVRNAIHLASRGMHVLARWERWALVGVIVVALLLTEQRLLFIVGGVAIWRALQKDAGPGDARVLLTFAGLVAVLSWLARQVR